MQAASDIMLGWIRAEDLDGRIRDFYVRQLWDAKGSALVELMNPKAMMIYAEVCGWTLAKAHARSGDAIAIASYLGGGDSFDRALAVVRRGLRRPERARLRRPPARQSRRVGWSPRQACERQSGATCRSSAGCRDTSARGWRATPWPGCRSGRCSSRRAWRTPRSPASPSSTGSTPRSRRCSLIPLFGTSRHLVAGPERGRLRRVCARRSRRSSARRRSAPSAAVGYTAALALATGVVYIALGLLRMGWVSTFLSKAVMAGFVLGLLDRHHHRPVRTSCSASTASDGSYAEELWGTIKELPDTSAATLAVGAGSLGAAAAACAICCRSGRAR